MVMNVRFLRYVKGNGNILEVLRNITIYLSKNSQYLGHYLNVGH
jgi:hypothetical protein